MVVVPALIALVLFIIGGIGKGKEGRSAEQRASERQSVSAERAQAAQNRQGAGNVNGTGEIPAADMVPLAKIPSAEPMQKIAFMAAERSGDRLSAQRSVPVQIDSSILGGEQWVNCWAVFLPAEMAEHPVVFLSGYQSVTMSRLEKGQYLDRARLGWEAESTDLSKGEEGEESGSSGTGAYTYSSGEVVAGLENGSAFAVDLKGEDGEVYSDILYVFSCSGTASMYLDTESGSMAAVDADPNKQVSEKGQFVVYLPDGSADSAGECAVSGRGNSSWNMRKRPYNVNLVEKQRVLGMSACKKLCLLANTFDPTNLLDRISSKMALDLGMRDTPEGEFVNLYLNGQYNGLYYLSQRPRAGGSVQIDKMDERIQQANGLDSYSHLPKKIALHKEGDRLKKWAYDWPNEPLDNTGGYLLQQYSRYKGDGCWFSTVHRRYRIMSPSYPTVDEVNYISDYMLSAERAIYSEDGKNPDSGKHYSEFLDLASWEDMFLLEEFFAEWDAERWSFYVIKDRRDPLLYCGPMWDFDHSAGLMIYGTYPETAVSTLLIRDSRHGWLNTLLMREEFARDLHERWRERFSPEVHNFLDNRMEEEISAIESAAYMNNIRRRNDTDFRMDADTLTTWLQRRLAFLDSYAGDSEENDGADRYCRVLFQFSWGDLSHYVLRSDEIGYLPLPEYGETQIPSQVEKNEIIGWQDENGNAVSAETVIDRDRVFSPIYRNANAAVEQEPEE